MSILLCEKGYFYLNWVNFDEICLQNIDFFGKVCYNGDMACVSWAKKWEVFFMKLKYDGISAIAEVPEANMDKEELQVMQNFLKSLAETLVKGFDSVKEPFLILMHEIKDGEKEPTWELSMSNQDMTNLPALFHESEERKLFSTVLAWKYRATCLANTEENYNGSFKSELIMFGQKTERGEWKADSRARILALSSAYFYQKKIVEFYPDWETAYINAPLMRPWGITQFE